MAASPTITSVQYANGVITAMWNPDGGSMFLLTVADTTTATATQYPNQVGFFAELTQALLATDAYTITVTCTDDGSGAPSPAVPVISATPVVTLVQNAVTSIDLAWDAAAGYGFVATLQTGGRVVDSHPTDGTSTQFDVQVPLTGDDNLVAVQLATTVSNAKSLGPPVQYGVITAVPTLTSVNYSLGENLALAWSALEGYDAFQAFLVPPAGDPTVNFVQALDTVFPGTLGAGTYTTYVCASSDDAVAIGPPSTAYQPITEAPTMTGVVNTGGGLTLSWDALAGVAAYDATMAQGGVPDTVRVTGTTFTFEGTPSGSAITAYVAATSADGVSLGPATQSYAVIVAAPAWSLIAYDAQMLSLDWVQIADPTVTGYLIDISNLGSYPAGNTNATTLDVDLAPLGSYATTVRATDGIVWGPKSYALVPLTVAPQSSVLAYNGTALRLSWTDSTERGVTGYVAELWAGGSVTETDTPSASPQVFAAAFAAATVYAARVRASGTQILGPWSQTAVGPYKSSVAYSFDTQARLTSEAWQDAATIAYTIDPSGNIQAVTPQSDAVE